MGDDHASCQEDKDPDSAAANEEKTTATILDMLPLTENTSKTCSYRSPCLYQLSKMKFAMSISSALGLLPPCWPPRLPPLPSLLQTQSSGRCQQSFLIPWPSRSTPSPPTPSWPRAPPRPLAFKTSITTRSSRLPRISACRSWPFTSQYISPSTGSFPAPSPRRVGSQLGGRLLQRHCYRA